MKVRSGQTDQRGGAEKHTNTANVLNAFSACMLTWARGWEHQGKMFFKMYVYMHNSGKVINAVEWLNKFHSANETLTFFYFSSRRDPQKGKQSEWKGTEVIEKRG